MKREIVERKPGHFLVCIVLVVAIFLINHSLLDNGFVSLDNDNILNNADIRGIRNLPDIFTSYLQTDYRFSYRPLTVVTYMMDHFLWESDPKGYHFTNLILHITTILLFYGIFTRIAGREYKAALLGSLLYALHPIHTEGAAFISGRSGVAGTMLGAASLFLLLRIDSAKPVFKNIIPEDAAKNGPPAIWLQIRHISRDKIFPVLYLMVPPLLYLLGMLCWEYAVIFPLFLLLFDLILNRKIFTDTKAMIRRAGVAYIPLLISLAAYIIIRMIVSKAAPMPSEPSPLMKYGNIPSHTFPGILSRYLFLLIFPFRLSFLQVLNPDFPIILSLVILLLSGAFFVLFLFKKPLVSCGMGFIFIGILPCAIFPIDNIIAERMMSLSIPGFCLFTGAVLAHFIQSRSPFLDSNRNLIITVISLSLLVFYSLKTNSRNGDWRSDASLWSSELTLHPQSPFVQNNLGLAYYKTGLVENAEKTFRKTLEIDPGFAPAYHNLARFLIDTKREVEGKQILEIAMQKGADADDANFVNIALMYLELGAKDAAEGCFQRALQANPKNTTALSESGSILFEKGQYREAIEYFNRALEAASGRERGRILSNRGISYYKTGDIEKADMDSQEALQLDPQLSHPYLTLASIEAQRKFPEKSVALLEEALQKAPTPPFDIYYALHQLYNGFDQPQKAFDILHEYLQKSPEDIRAQIAMGKYCLAWYEKNPEDTSKLYTAVTCFKNAHKLDPRNTEVLIIYGKTAVLSEDLEAAEKIWNQVLQIDPKNTEAQKLLQNLKSGKTQKPSSK
jgi:tetratricopeptide (TPR) repeat protein